MPAEKLKLKSILNDNLPIPGAEPWYVCEADPAVSVMIDYRTRASVTLSDVEPLDEALQHMKHAGVRCAFVVDRKKKAVVGMLTAYDISGEKPQQYMHLVGVPMEDVQVKDIMQKITDWKVADIKDIERSTVGELLNVFKESGVSHLPVLETTENNEQRLRGLLSFAKVKRLLVD
jgi:CBS domain-containing protein